MSLRESLSAIPPHKRKPKILSVVVGGAVFVGGFAIPKYLGFPWQVGVVVAFFGGFIASKEMVLAFARVVPQTLAALVRGLSGKNGDAAP